MNNTLSFRMLLGILIIGSFAPKFLNAATVHPFTGLDEITYDDDDGDTTTGIHATMPDDDGVLQENSFKISNFTRQDYIISIININTNIHQTGPIILKDGARQTLPIINTVGNIIVYYFVSMKAPYDTFAFTLCPRETSPGDLFHSFNNLIGPANLLEITYGFTSWDKSNQTALSYYYLKKNRGEHSTIKIAILEHPSGNSFILEKINKATYARPQNRRNAVSRPISFITPQNECPKCFSLNCCCGCCSIM